MNFIFRSYPSHPWISDWTLEPRGCTTAMRSAGTGHFFQTLETVGRIAPNREPPEWVLQIPVPQNSRINLLCNGFCAYFERRKKRCGAEVLVPEPGVLWGRTFQIPPVTLASEQPLETEDPIQWLDNDDSPALLATRENRFCLVSKAHLKNDALRMAESYLERDFEEAIALELQARAGAERLFQEMTHHDSLAAICAESMLKALRPPEGSIPLSWSQSPATDTPQFDLDELFPLALAWRLVDPAVAEELLTCALRVQTNAGAIPVHYAPHTTHSVLESPKPMMAKTVETVWETRRSEDFLNTAVPLLRRHIQWMLHHFDPQRKRTYCWKGRAECIDPSLYETDLATVDLTVLLLTEIEALNRLRAESSAYQTDPTYFEAERELLERDLIETFWNPEESAFINAVQRDKMLTIKGFPAFTPLLWNALPAMQKNAVLMRIQESGALPGGLSVLTWRKSAMDDNSFPILQQLLTFQALKQADPNGSLLSDFARITLQGFVEWHSLSLEQGTRLQINPVTAAFIMNVQSIRQYRYHAKGGVSGRVFKLLRKARADRFDLIVVLATLFALFSFHTLYDILRAPPPLEVLEAKMNESLSQNDIETTLDTCRTIIKKYPDDASRARLLAGNILLLHKQFPTAAGLFEQVRKENPDSPGPMVALGLCQQLQGNFKAAESNYYEFCYIFEEIFPEPVAEVNRFRQLAYEEFTTPPKWQEIYRYQFMHEL